MYKRLLILFIYGRADVTITASNDTICNGGSTGIKPVSTTATNGIRYTWTVTDHSGGYDHGVIRTLQAVDRHWGRR